MALALGKTLGEINAIPHDEYLGWMEFYELEPWGVAVDDALNAYGIATLANVNRDSSKTPKPYGIKDFLLFGQGKSSGPELVCHEDPDQQTEAMIAGMFGGDVIRADRLFSNKRIEK